jgi:hypothetical protein
MDEARKQFENYDKLFTYMNQQTDWNVDVRILDFFIQFDISYLIKYIRLNLVH